MKFYFLSIISIVFTLISCQGSSKQIKSITETSYVGIKTKKGVEKVRKGWENSWEKDSKTNFDKDGNQLDKTFYDAKSKISRVDQFIYADGRIRVEESLNEAKIYQYDANWRLTLVYVANRFQNQINTWKAGSYDDQISAIYQHAYDEKGRLIRMEELDADKHVTSITIYKYDQKNRLINELEATEEQEEMYIYEYDADDNLIVKTWIDRDDGVLEKETFTYENKVKIKEVFENFTDQQPDGKIVYTYENGNEKEIYESDETGEIYATSRYKYTYDPKGNWTKRILTTNAGKIFVVEREIIYY